MILSKIICLELWKNGTAKTAAVEGYDVGGKTGTAEKLPRGNGKVSGLFYSDMHHRKIHRSWSTL